VSLACFEVVFSDDAHPILELDRVADAVGVGGDAANYALRL
jgi:hypothetical protein